MSVPIDRIIEKENSLLARNDYEGARRLLDYWLSEAEATKDERGIIEILSEQMGLFRKMLLKDEAISVVDRALGMEAFKQMAGTEAHATIMLNAATVLNAFDETKRAIVLYHEVQKIYEAGLGKTNMKLAGLYNNMASCYDKLSDYKSASDNYLKAIEIDRANNAFLEEAVTFVNMANLFENSNAKNKEELIEKSLTKASELLNSPDIARDGYYAFMAEKCADGFEYFGYFMYAKELRARAERIYSGDSDLS